MFNERFVVFAAEEAAFRSNMFVHAPRLDLCASARWPSFVDLAHESGVVEVLTETVLSLQDSAPVGTLATDLDDVVAYRAEIHQACGMVSVQLQIPVAEALLRVRAHAFADGRPVGDVARDIVARRLRLTDDRDDREDW